MPPALPLQVLFGLAAAGLAVGIGLRRERFEARGPGLPLALGGAGFVVLLAAERIATALPPGAPALALRLLAALAGLLAWCGVAALAFVRLRRRDLFWIAPFGLFALLNLLAARPLAAWTVLMTLPVIARWRWLDFASRRTTGLALLGSLALPVLAFLPLSTPPAAPAAEYLARVAGWARLVTGVYLLFALPGLLVRWTVGIRRVSRRLALLLLLSGAVPVALILVMWAVTTQLGVRAERALFASRLIDQSGVALRASLAAAGRSAEPAATLAATHPGWRELRLWRDGARLHGAPVAADSALRAWPDSLPQSGLVRLAGVPYLGARTVVAADTLVALAPMQEVLRTDIQPALDVTIEVLSVSVSDSAGEAPEAADRGGLHASRQPGADTSAVRLSVGGQQVIAGGQSFGLTAGHGLVKGLVWSDGRWSRADGMLSVDLRLGRIVTGLADSVRENPMNLLPMALIGVLALLMVMIAGADFGMVRTLGRSITAAIAALRQGAARLEAGELSYRIPVGGEDDLWEVAGAFNRMAAGLERGRQLEIERQRLEDELALARRIQARLFPAAPPSVEGVELAGRSEPAREVGGDYYDFLALGSGRVALVIADVSGKGVGAALLMSAFRASLLSQDLAGGQLAAVAARLNQFLHHSVEPGKFVTAFLAVLDGPTGRLRYCNAGHNAPIVVGVDGAVRRLEAGGLILGILPESEYETGETVLAPGERLVLFTDGVTEAANEADEQWEEERFVSLLRASAAAPCADVVERVVAEVRRFEGGRGASDDVTLIVARRAAGPFA